MFQLAASDGSRAFFTDEQRLTGDAGASPGRPDLYECLFAEVAGRLACELSDLTPRSGNAGAGVVGVMGAGEDGEWVYFTASRVLAEGAAPGDCNSEAGGTCNLYVNHDGETTLVAVLSSRDENDWTEGGLNAQTARVSPNGEWLAFMSQRELTAYDSHDATSGMPDEEVYLYHAVAGGGRGKLVCASCNPTGARPMGIEYRQLNDGLAGGDRLWKPETWLAANVPGWTSFGGASLYQSRYLSDQGRLFFNSSDALVPQDINGTEDVYEYEPVGIGDCSVVSATFGKTSGGCVDLISSGTSSGV